MEPFSSCNLNIIHHIPTRIILVVVEQTSLPNSALFPIEVPIELLRTVPQEACKRVSVHRSRRTTGSSIFDHEFGQVCRGRRIQKSGHSDFGILSSFWSVLHFHLGASGYCVGCLSCTIRYHPGENNYRCKY